MKIVTVIGARPQFVKHATFQYYLLQKESRINNLCIHTGQHFDKQLTTDVCSDFGIHNPDFDLKINASRATDSISQMINLISEKFREISPAYVLLYGDTNSTLAGALAANLLELPIIHVEAGLRSFDMRMPEERNRIITDRLSQKLIVPDSRSEQNLKNEGIPTSVSVKGNLIPQEVHDFGDIMYDSHILTAPKYKSIKIKRKNAVLLTLHRANLYTDYSFFEDILKIVKYLSSNYNVIFPAHPRMLKNIEYCDRFRSLGVEIIQPLSYLRLQAHISNSEFVVTDSGGLQKEAFYHRKYCITLRETTEWTATLTGGRNQLVGSSIDKFKIALNSVSEKLHQSRQECFVNPYGDGSFCKKLETLILGNN